MSAVETLLAAASDAGVKLWVEGGELRFRAPKGAVTPQLRTALQAQKPELIARLGSRAAAAIAHVPDVQDYPLSSGQRRLWILAQMDENSAAYHIPLALRLDGPLDRDGIASAVDVVVRRHESLRTRFVTVNGEPRQCVDPDGHVTVEWHDFSDAHDAEAEALSWVTAASTRPFDLAQGPLVRVGLLKLGPERHVVSAALHHIVADGVSLVVFVRELAEAYAAERRGEKPKWAELPLQYRDFAVWQLAQAAGAALQLHRKYWLEKLKAVPSALELPTDRPRPAMQSFRGRIHAFRLEPALLQGLRGLARGENATLFIVLVALVKVLLRRQTGRDDIVVASPIAGREHADLEGQIGFFLNTLVLRDLVQGEAAFSSLLRAVRLTALEAYEHQAYPFEQLVDDLALPRDLSRAPLCDVVVMLQNTGDLRLALPGVSVRPFVADPGISKFDLTFDFQEGSEGLDVGLEFNTDLFDGDRMERLAEAFGEIARRAVANPAQSVAALGALPAAEEMSVVRSFNATMKPVPVATTVVTLIEAHAAKVPAATAVGSGGILLSYAELNARANRLAHHLRQLGAGPDVPIGVCLERTVELPVALLAVLKTGAHYVPLDPGFPHERLAFMVGDAGASILIAETSTSAPWGDAQGRRIVRIDADAAAIAAHPDRDHAPVADADHTAYVIYTSGSTGRPKGVQVIHRGLTNFLVGMAESPGLGAHDVLLAVTTISFDIAGLELWLPLTLGARIELVKRETVGDGMALIELLRDSGATVMQATPATWRLMLAAGWKGTSGLRAYCGGEALSGDLAAELLPRCDELWNLYGPTETTIWSTLHRVTAADTTDATVTIGRPMANTQCYVLDVVGSPVPIGVPGNLWIGGLGVARGYWRRPELTAEKFVPDPFGGAQSSPQDGASEGLPKAACSRMYQTGDIARWRADGTLVFLGRGDQQVKLRGYRIETGEIEHALLAHPAVSAAAVSLREDTPGDPHLVAYIVPRESSFDPASLREHLRTRLPEYMVPSVWASLTALPLTANGKVDRRTLPAPGEAERATGTAAPIGPRNPGEEVVAAVWADVLGLPFIGIHDDFFEMGGHSLKATMAIVRLREQTSGSFTIADIFRRPTVAAFSELLVGADAGGHASGGASGVAPITAEELEFLNG